MEIGLFDVDKKMDFSQCKTYEEINDVFSKIFTNNPYFWGRHPLYLDYNGNLSKVVKGALSNKINIYEYKFSWIEPDETKPEDIIIYNHCFDISRVRSNPLLPLVYYNAFLHMDTLGLSMHRMDNTSKIMYVRKNKYTSIFDEIKRHGDRFDLSYFLYASNMFVDIDDTIRCECGSVDAYRVEAGIFYGADAYIIFPFPTGDKLIGSMYCFEKA
jgi:hypothetical protein